MNRIKSIDGLRAISIGMVLLGHAFNSIPIYLRENVAFQCFANGPLGVKFFFVISGYLITKLLLIEQKKTGFINVKHFYLRRAFRIFPVFYIYILFILTLKWTFIPNLVESNSLFLFASLYLWNYMHLFNSSVSPSDNGLWFFGHFWSLSMEEQFYLLWPLAFKKININILLKIVLIIIVLMPIIRLATYFAMPGSRGQIGMMLQTGGDTILTGCLGAILESKVLTNNKITNIMKNNFSVFLSVIFLFVISPWLTNEFGGRYNLSVGMSLSNFIILFLLLWSIHIPSLVSRVLNTKLFVHFGVLSYSLYVWQQLFLTNKISFWVNFFPQNLAIVILVALFSYYIIEKPVLNLKNRFKNI